jgi:hypothetical protein
MQEKVQQLKDFVMNGHLHQINVWFLLGVQFWTRVSSAMVFCGKDIPAKLMQLAKSQLLEYDKSQLYTVPYYGTFGTPK